MVVSQYCAKKSEKLVYHHFIIVTFFFNIQVYNASTNLI